MPPPRAEFSRRAVRSLWPAALLALAPKCLLCALAYAGLGTALGLGGPEICGAPAGSTSAWASALAWLGAAGGLGASGLLAIHRHKKRPAEQSAERAEVGFQSGALPLPRMCDRRRIR